MADKKYNVIYADPPWKYQVWSKKGNGRSAESHYPTMGIDDLCKLPVQRIAADDCALFMWVTFPLLYESIKLIKAWGFEYKTVAFVWVKLNKKADSLFWGMGYWTRANAELCILPPKVTRNVTAPAYTRSFFPTLRNTARNPNRHVTVLFNLWEMSQELNCLHGRQTPDGMYGEMKSSVPFLLKKRFRIPIRKG